MNRTAKWLRSARGCQQLLRYSTESTETYASAFKQSIEDPASFWSKQAEELDWHKRWHTVLDNSNAPFTKWFVGGELNMCYNAVDRHVNGEKRDTTAVIYDSPVTGQKQYYSYARLLHMVRECAGILEARGVRRGDTVLIYMPMIPECLVAMLACARLGATHCVVFGGFASRELAVRIAHVKPKAIVTASVAIEPNRIIAYKPILDEAIKLSDHEPRLVLVHHRRDVELHENPITRGRDHDWANEAMRHSLHGDAVPLPSEHPLYIIHTSGTTDAPKGIVRDTGGYATVLPWTMKAIYGMRDGETWWAASDFGWVVGHSYICYAPLLAGLTTLIYEGKPVGTPNSGQYFRLIAEHKISNFFCAPTALRAIRQNDPDVVYGKNLRCVHAAGEKLDHETRVWAQREFKVPVLDHWWQTESGWPIAAQCIGYRDANWQPPRDCTGRPVPGWNVQVIEEQGGDVSSTDSATHMDKRLGRIVVKTPLPPGFASTFWPDNKKKFLNSYFTKYPGYYDTADAGLMIDGQVAIMARVDDVINVAGHRLSTGALEEAVLRHPEVCDCAVVGLDDKLKGQIPLALCVLGDNASVGASVDRYEQQVARLVREELGAVAALKRVLFVPKLPKTRSGKIVRSTLAAMANQKPYKIPVTIEDETVYPVIEAIMEAAKIIPSIKVDDSEREQTQG